MKWEAKETFVISLCFVLGFSVVFSILGVLLQTVLVNSADVVQTWLARIGGLFIIGFGLHLLGLITLPGFDTIHRISVTKKFSSRYITAFIFGAAFAVGWSPCVGAVLGSILALAASNPSSALVLLMSYTLGLGIPFLILGAFSTTLFEKLSRVQKWTAVINTVFGVLLIILGMLIFVNQLSRLANIAWLTELFGVSLAIGSTVTSLTLISVSVAFIAGIVSFLSPCVLPLLPGFLLYLTSTARKGGSQ